MEPRYLDLSEHVKSRALYEEVFTEDEKAFVDAYYKIKAASNQILVLEDKGEIVSMLHLNPYKVFLREKLFDVDYIVAVATKANYRNQGCMRKLLTKALQDLYLKKHPFTFLMPASEAIYTPFGFRRMENQDDKELALLTNEELIENYDLFIWKDADYERQHIPETAWEKTPMMMRIVHLPSLLESMISTEEASIVISITDDIIMENNGTFRWDIGKKDSRVTKLETGTQADITSTIADFGRYLFQAIGKKYINEVV